MMVHATHEEIERWMRTQRQARKRTMIELVHATLPLLNAAIAGHEAVATELNAHVATGWEGFPEALPMLRDTLEPGSPWGTTLFVLASPRTLVGMGGFKGPPQVGVVEIGYAIAPAFQGRGLATAAARQLVERAFADAGVSAVDAHTLGERNASVRVLEKLGMRRIAEVLDPEHGAIWHWRVNR
jgi:[ribosomal protein S5]-alanine N-acetyltransferase